MQLNLDDGDFVSAVDEKSRNFAIRNIGNVYFIDINTKKKHTITIKRTNDALKEFKVSHTKIKWSGFYAGYLRGDPPTIIKATMGLDLELEKIKNAIKQLNNGK